MSVEVYPPVLHLIPGVSGCGKTTMAKYLVKELGDTSPGPASLVVPHTTRPIRPHEKEGQDYFFHTPEEYHTVFEPQVKDAESDWEASQIGEHYYFNCTSATRPNEQERVKVLPVAFGALENVVEEHSGRGYGVSILPIIISEQIKEKWLAFAQQQRPMRNLRAELEEQTTFVEEYPGNLFYPAWDFESDAQQYLRESELVMRAACLAIYNT